MVLATLTIPVREEMVLLGENLVGPFKGLLNGPGGKILFPHETVIDCAIREPHEEMGIIPDRAGLSLAGFLNCHVQEERTMGVYVLIATSFSGEPQNTEVMRYEWHHKNSIPYERMFEADQYWLPQALNGQFFGDAYIYYSTPGRGLLRPVEFFPMFKPATF